ncbi:HAD family hydrolase [Paenibacillus sp. CMAA1739]|uniref:HAD family hydrolase n=1 Tax=Paenibacillus ottowii TaxID=2315729 RepID=UPI002730C0C9|nr:MULTISPECIES: HAD family hydrolase [Paenibacillus]MDP1512520.1 HAD family hydrolase [Paenibacillus ottowii]MEC4564386.1 HAD family hydrolase [Paenibacillus sp. CMAA1739]
MSELIVQGMQYPCRGILFDKDGTLLDFIQLWGPWARSILDMMEQHLAVAGAGFTMEKGNVLGTVHDQEGRVIGYDPSGPLAMGTVDESTGVLAWQLYTAGIPWNEAVQLVREFNKTAMADVRRQRAAKVFSGLRTLLEQSRRAGMKLAVVTSDSTEAAQEHLEWMGLTSYFDVIIGHDRVTYGKPDPEMAEKACELLGLSPMDVVVIGDSNGDMQMGKRAGVRLAIGFAPEPERSRHLLDADKVVRGYEELEVRRA